MAEFVSRNGKLFIDGQEVIRGFESYSGWYWFATEESHRQESVIEGKVYKDDQIYFGYVQGHEDEWGNFSETELKLLKPKVWEIPKKNLPY
ncbi:hypothetical protein ACFL6S_25145, partial [Candidatus Poribacteria bacterium]